MSLKFPMCPNCFSAQRRHWLQRLSLVAAPGWAWIALLLPGCSVVHSDPTITGSGRTVTRGYEQSGFHQVVAGSAFQVSITRGENWSLAVTVDDNLLEFVEVVQSKETLRLGLKPNLSIRQATLKADVTMPELTGLELGGASRAAIDGFSSDRSLEVELHGASRLRGDIKSGDARFQASGASHLELTGRARSLKVKASGASHVGLERFGSENATVTASGASHVTVNAQGNLEVEASGASSVRYLGTPASVNSHASGASSVRRQ